MRLMRSCSIVRFMSGMRAFSSSKGAPCSYSSLMQLYSFVSSFVALLKVFSAFHIFIPPLHVKEYSMYRGTRLSKRVGIVYENTAKKRTASTFVQTARLLLCSYVGCEKLPSGLALRDSSCRTLSCACSAVYTSVRIDLVVVSSLRDSSYWTFSFASAAAYTFITNYMCHDIFLL